MISTSLWLGAISGLTILIGLPFAFLKVASPRLRSFITSFTTGILVFLLVEITSRVMEQIEDLSMSAADGFQTTGDTIFYGALFAAGLFAGLMSLVWFEKRFISKTSDTLDATESAHRLSLMIAIGLGLHNFAEGLAVGQAFGWGNTSLTLLLVTGFALHNATEGFGIVGPLAGHRTSWGFLGLLGLIGGLPTVLGSLLGSIWTIKPVEVFVLAIASGSILYVIGELLHVGKKLKQEMAAASGLLAGFFLAFVAEVVIAIATGGLQQS
jgi:zinc transporter, ZIP family